MIDTFNLQQGTLDRTAVYAIVEENMCSTTSRYIFSTKPAIKGHILGIDDRWWGIPQSNGYNKNKYILSAFLIKIDF